MVFLCLFAVKALKMTLAVYRWAWVLLIERVLPAKGAANGVNITNVDF